MRSHARMAAVSAVSGVLLAVAVSGSAAAAATSPVVGSSPVTLSYYVVSTGSNLYSANGQVVSDQNAQPAVGDYTVGTDNDYAGTQASHSSEVAATDHLYCLITKAPATATCSGQIAFPGGMLFSDNSNQDFSSNSATMNFPITGGTGAYQGAHGNLVSTTIGNTNNSEFVITVSK